MYSCNSGGGPEMPDLKPERQGFPYRRYIVARKKSKEITENAGRGGKKSR